MPAAITALDFSRPPARPPFFGAGAGAGSGAAGSAAGGRSGARVVARGGGRGSGHRSGGVLLRAARRLTGIGAALGAGVAAVLVGVGAALLLVAEEVREGVRLVALLPGLADEVVHADVLRGARVVSVRQVLSGAVRLRSGRRGPHPGVGRVRRLGRLPVEGLLRLLRAGRGRRVRRPVVEGLRDRVLGGDVLRPVGILAVGVLDVRVGGWL